MNSGGGHDAVAGLERRNKLGLLLLPAHLGTDHHVIHDDDEENEGQHAEKAGAPGAGRWSRRLSEKKEKRGHDVVEFVALAGVRAQSRTSGLLESTAPLKMQGRQNTRLGL